MKKTNKMKVPIFILINMVCINLSFSQSIDVSLLGRYTNGTKGACEISAYDSSSKKLFVTNASADSIDIIDISNPASPTRIGGIDISIYGGGINSVVNIGNGYFAAAIEDTIKQDSGSVVFFTTAGVFTSKVKVGSLPDMIAVTKDKKKILIACEGEPSDDYLNDPEGSVAIIDISGGISTLNQTNVKLLKFDNAPTTIVGSVKKSSVSFAQDLEPEYIAINDNSTTAAVICQENNVFVFIDLVGDSITGYKGLGFKDHSLSGNGMDVSNKDDTINIKTWNVKGVYQPDAIYSYKTNGKTYYVSANEGDSRDYSGYSSETRVKNLTLDTFAFPNYAFLQQDSVLGRLKTFTPDVLGDADGNDSTETIYSYGARSFSIWDAEGTLVWDSGDDFEQYIKSNYSDFFNCNDGLASKKENRSDDKGPEPEAIVVGEIGGKFYAFIGLERQGGIMIYDVTNPLSPVFVTYTNSIQSSTGDMVDIAPEGLLFIPAAQSHTNKNLLIASNEVSGTVAIYQITDLDTISEQPEGIAEVMNSIELYPNPCTDYISIKNKTTDNYSYRIISNLGVVVKESRLMSTNNISLTELNSGFYTIVFSNHRDNSIVVKKIIKK